MAKNSMAPSFRRRLQYVIAIHLSFRIHSNISPRSKMKSHAPEEAAVASAHDLPVSAAAATVAHHAATTTTAATTDVGLLDLLAATATAATAIVRRLHATTTTTTDVDLLRPVVRLETTMTTDRVVDLRMMDTLLAVAMKMTISVDLLAAVVDMDRVVRRVVVTVVMDMLMVVDGVGMIGVLLLVVVVRGVIEVLDLLEAALMAGRDMVIAEVVVVVVVDDTDDHDYNSVKTAASMWSVKSLSLCLRFPSSH